MHRRRAPCAASRQRRRRRPGCAAVPRPCGGLRPEGSVAEHAADLLDRVGTRHRPGRTRATLLRWPGWRPASTGRGTGRLPDPANTGDAVGLAAARRDRAAQGLGLRRARANLPPCWPSSLRAARARAANRSQCGGGSSRKMAAADPSRPETHRRTFTRACAIPVSGGCQRKTRQGLRGPRRPFGHEDPGRDRLRTRHPRQSTAHALAGPAVVEADGHAVPWEIRRFAGPRPTSSMVTSCNQTDA